MAERMQGALADLLREIGRMDRRLEALQAAETGTGGGGGGAGTVTSVALSLPAILTVSGSPVTTAGTLTAVLATQSANRVFAGPTSGGAAAPTFRALVAADIPALPYGTGTVTSVALSLPAILTVSGSPVTTAGTLTAVLAEQYANLVFAGPVSGVGTSTPTFRALVAADLPAGTGTVTSVALSLPAILTVSGSPVTTAGTLTAVLATQAANLVWAGPTTGAAAAPTFRALVAADMAASVAGTAGAIAKFTATNVVGNSIITESGAAISVAGSISAVGQSNTYQLILKGFSTQTAPQLLIQNSAAAELGRLYMSANNSIALGYLAGQALTIGLYNILIGLNAGAAISTTASNVVIGVNAYRVGTGGGNIAIGNNAFYYKTFGYDNQAIGSDAGQKATTADWSCFIGTEAGMESLAVYGCMHLGYRSGKFHQTGDDCIFIGAQTGSQSGVWSGGGVTIIGGLAGNAASGASNTFIGYRAGQNAGTSTQLVAIGADTGRGTGAYTASYSVLIGSGAGYTGPGNGNTLIGQNAGYPATSANNAGIGYEVLRTLTSGANNVAIGYQAGYSLTTNGAGVFIGYQAGYSETGANRLYISNSNTTTPLVYGLFSGTGAGLRITSQATDGVALVVRGKASQASALQEWQDSAATVVAQINKSGMICGSMDTMAYAAAITLDVALANLHKTTTVHATGAATINASAAGTAGQHIWVLIVNDATSGKVITFGTNFKSAGTLTGTTSKQAIVHFVSDGVSWSEVARTLNL